MVRSSSPKAPSVMLNVTVLPLVVAGMVYQCGVVLAGVGPYFQYFVEAGSGVGVVTTNVSVDPGVQPLVTKSIKPCAKRIPVGAVPTGGDVEAPVSGMNAARVNPHSAPPPVKAIRALPLLVAVGPPKEVPSVRGAGFINTVVVLEVLGAK